MTGAVASTRFQGLPFLRGAASQVAVSLLATVCASALFALAPMITPHIDADKAAQRLPAGEIPTTTLQVDVQQSALLASLRTFRPIADPSAAEAARGAARQTARAREGGAHDTYAFAAMPVPRPFSLTLAPLQTTSPGADLVAQKGWRIAGLEIPKSTLPTSLSQVSLPQVSLSQMSMPRVGIPDTNRVRMSLPSVSLPDVGAAIPASKQAIVRSGAFVWDTSTEAVKKVSSFGSDLLRKMTPF